MLTIVGPPGHRTSTLFLVGLALISLVAEQAACLKEEEIVRDWAEKFGDELWRLGEQVTKSPEIKHRYKMLNARVERKDGKQLLRSAVTTVGRMLARKMESIRCLQTEAERAAEFSEYDGTNFTYYSSKFSSIDDEPPAYYPEEMEPLKMIWRNMSLNADTHFYDIPVNTEHSSVHVPTNVYEKGPDVANVIQWSEELEQVFVQNYKSDPALSWQYFCSVTGILRQYPAVSWPQDPDEKVDEFDCRTRSWYIEASTCSKDVIILFDNSGSMSGFNHFLARFTVREILETFSNNDFFNIIAFSNDTIEVVPCFEDKLMQATPDNMRTFNEALKILKPDGHANFSLAFSRAFEILENYRISRGCDEASLGCNQAIMLVTDGIPGNLTEVFEKYNRFNDTRPEIPVRIFTYLIGKEVTNVREIQWLACLNRGYYVHIQSLDEVQENVLKYIDVIARPLVIQEVDHPITWTHAYTDITPSEKPLNAKYQTYRLMISVAIPLFDKKANKNNETRIANLLGVAGADIPIDEIEKLTLPYKLGVNGYAFIVSNNGYLILHPELRPVYKGVLKEMYNSMDLVDLETFDDGLDIYEYSDAVKELRSAMVNGSEGSMMDVKVRLLYDKQRRISRERQDYYYAPIPTTSFTLGIALPHDYGNTWIKVGDQVQINSFSGLNMIDFFSGDNWKIHPRWVYCKYHYLEGHEFKTPEEELRHFIEKMGESNWKWSEQYEQDPNDDDFDDEINCSDNTLENDAYFCNKELVQLLVFDAKVTHPLYTTWEFKNDTEHVFRKYNATLRFVATMSGLTRWQFIFGEDMNDTESEFGDYFTKAIDETWYKSAILQHQIEAESFVFSVPIKSGSRHEEAVRVTASRAVFPRDGGLEAPAAVLGYQFSHQLLYNRFMEITSDITECEECAACDSPERDCYVLDSSGHIIISEVHNETGKFFGEIEGPIMEEMINANIYQKIAVFDVHGVCVEIVSAENAASILKLPIHYVGLVLQWIGAQIVWLLMKTHLTMLWGDYSTQSYYIDDYYEDNFDYTDEGGEAEKKQEERTTPKPKLRKNFDPEEAEYFSRPHEKPKIHRNCTCERKGYLYVLQQKTFLEGEESLMNNPANCSRPFNVKRIPHSNMILVVTNVMYPSCYQTLHAGMRNEPCTGPSCQNLQLVDLPRRRLEGCYTTDELEAEVTACGRSGDIQISLFLVILCWMILRYRSVII